MKKVLLTGATGLIGKYAIQPFLDEGFEVFAISTKEQQNKQGLNWIKADFLNFENIKKAFEEVKPEYLLHFAWDTTPGTYLEDNLNFDWVQTSMEMLKQFKAQGGKRAVFAGTCFEYEFDMEGFGQPLRENSKLNPKPTYARCKNLLNQLASLYSQKNDISFGWGRIFYVYGENEQDKRLIPVVINTLMQDDVFITSAGELIKDYMFAADIAAGFVKFLQSDVQGDLNICTGEHTKIKDIVSLIAKKMGKEHLVKFEGTVEGQPKAIVGDNSKLRNEVGFEPKYSLEEGVNVILNSMAISSGIK